MALEAVNQIESDSRDTINGYEVRNVEFLSGLAVPTDEEGIETHISLRNAGDTSGIMEPGYQFCIRTYEDKSAVEVCRGLVRAIHTEEKSSQKHESYESKELVRNVMLKAEELVDQASTQSKQVSGQSLYNRWYKMGYQYGDGFRRLGSIHYNDKGEAVGNISVLDNPIPSPSIIHPATLDGIVQMILPAATRGGNVDTATMVPTRIDRLWLSNSRRLVTGSTTPFQSHVTLLHQDARSVGSAICVFDPNEGDILVNVESLEALAITESEIAQESSELPRRFCFDMVSKPDVSLLSKANLRKVLAQARDKTPDPSEEWFAISSFVSALVNQISQEIDAADIPSSLPHLAKQLSWIKSHSTSGGKHDRMLEELYGRVERQGRLGEIYSIFGRHLNRILKGEVDALEVLSQNNILQDYYNITGDTWKFWGSLKLYLQLLAHKNPALKIMEVGAGTGSTTKYILEALSTVSSHGQSSKYSRFDFTDVSHSFLAKAEDLFDSYPKIHYGIFDVEQDPVSQGFEPGSYDVIVAANVSTDSYRATSPLLTEEQWHATLLRNGFSGLDVAFNDYDTGHHNVSLMVSSAVEDAVPTAAPDQPMRVITGFVPSTTTALTRSVQEHLRLQDMPMDTFQAAAEDKNLDQQLTVIICDSSWPAIDQLNDEQYPAFRTVLAKSKALLWITETPEEADSSPQHSLVTGLARTLRLERFGLTFTTLTLNSINKATYGQHIIQAFQNTLHGIRTEIYEPELNAAEEFLTIPRVYEDDSLNQAVHTMVASQQQDVAFGDRNLILKIQTPGLLDSLYFEEVPYETTALKSDELEVEVKSVGVNFKDVIVAMGQIKEDSFGYESSGVVVRTGSACSIKVGERVVLSRFGLRRAIRCSQSDVEIVPNEMSFAEAASIPCNFITAYYSLVDIARLNKGETILIHSGAGGTGQAAIQVAQYCGAKVFVTVGSDEKRNLLMELYNIPSDQILYSRDLSFVKGIKRLTGGKGVDVILNSLSGSSLLASWECIAPYGRFIEIGKRDILSRRNLPMFQFSSNVTFSAVDLGLAGKERPELVSRCLHQVLKLFSQGALRVVHPLTIFPINQVEQAFRHLQSGKNGGKVVVDIEPHVQVPALLKGTSQWKFSENSTYVIAGGLGGQGRSAARWLASKGARHLLLLSRSGVNNESATRFMKEMTLAGVNVYAPACNISDSTSLKNVLEYCESAMPPIKGCIQSSMVLRDGSFEAMSCADWKEPLQPKVAGSWNLHNLLPRNLDFFVFLSSLTGVVGSQYQANYAAGNTFQDHLAHLRVSRGERATSVSLGAMMDEGYLVGRRDVLDVLLNVKQLLPMSQAELFAIFDQYCQPSSPFRPHVITCLQLPAEAAAKGLQLASWMSLPIFSHLHQLSSSTSSSLTDQATSSSSSTSDDLYTTLKPLLLTSSAQELTPILTTALSTKLAKFLSLPVSDYDTSKPLHSYGIDSLIAMELRNWFRRVLKVEVSVFEILGGASTRVLAGTLAGKMVDAANAAAAAREAKGGKG
ncbi:MAG: hypothetical protein Q9160_007156 [Pyrenula sp. 1 TL-2023]